MGWPKATKHIIEGTPVSGRLTEQIVFAPGLSAPMKIKILQLAYKYPSGFTYKNIMDGFNVTKRTGMRWIQKMKQLGLLQKVPNYGFSRSGKYKIEPQKRVSNE